MPSRSIDRMRGLTAIAILFTFSACMSASRAQAVTNGKSPFPYTVAFVSFGLGLLSVFITEVLKRQAERRRLLDLLLTDIHYGWQHLDRIRHYRLEAGTYSAYDFWEVDGIKFTGPPHLNFEVYDLEFLKAEGARLAQVLRQPTQEKLWSFYRLVRRVEAIRHYLVETDTSSTDYKSYEALFGALVDRLADQILELSDTLYRQKHWGWKPAVGRATPTRRNSVDGQPRASSGQRGSRPGAR